MAVKSEIFPITLKLKIAEDSGIQMDQVLIDIENSEIYVFNDRGGQLIHQTGRDIDNGLFADNENLLVGFLWDTSLGYFSVQDYYAFEFIVAINYTMKTGEINTTDPDNPQPVTVTKSMKLVYTVNKLLESNNRM